MKHVMNNEVLRIIKDKIKEIKKDNPKQWQEIKENFAEKNYIYNQQKMEYIKLFLPNYNEIQMDLIYTVLRKMQEIADGISDDSVSNYDPKISKKYSPRLLFRFLNEIRSSYFTSNECRFLERVFIIQTGLIVEDISRHDIDKVLETYSEICARTVEMEETIQLAREIKDFLWLVYDIIFIEEVDVTDIDCEKIKNIRIKNATRDLLKMCSNYMKERKIYINNK